MRDHEIRELQRKLETEPHNLEGKLRLWSILRRAGNFPFAENPKGTIPDRFKDYDWHETFAYAGECQQKDWGYNDPYRCKFAGKGLVCAEHAKSSKCDGVRSQPHSKN